MNMIEVIQLLEDQEHFFLEYNSDDREAYVIEIQNVYSLPEEVQYLLYFEATKGAIGHEYPLHDALTLLYPQIIEV